MGKRNSRIIGLDYAIAIRRLTEGDNRSPIPFIDYEPTPKPRKTRRKK